MWFFYRLTAEHYVIIFAREYNSCFRSTGGCHNSMAPQMFSGASTKTPDTQSTNQDQSLAVFLRRPEQQCIYIRPTAQRELFTFFNHTDVRHTSKQDPHRVVPLATLVEANFILITLI